MLCDQREEGWMPRELLYLWEMSGELLGEERDCKEENVQSEMSNLVLQCSHSITQLFFKLEISWLNLVRLFCDAIFWSMSEQTVTPKKFTDIKCMTVVLMQILFAQLLVWLIQRTLAKHWLKQCLAYSNRSRTNANDNS